MLAIGHAVPTISQFHDFVTAGGLMGAVHTWPILLQKSKIAGR